MTILQFLRALRARAYVFALVVLTTVAVAAAVSVVLPKSYRSTVALLVDARDEQTLNTNAQALVFNQPQERQSYMQTQMDIIGSRKVAHAVVQKLRLAEMPSAKRAFAEDDRRTGTIEDFLVDDLLRKLKIETTQSNVINVTYNAGDPAYAAQVANAFAQAYVQTVLELRVAPAREAAAWFDDQLKVLKSNLEAAQTKLTEFLQAKKLILSPDERMDFEGSRLGVLSELSLRAQEQSRRYAGPGATGELPTEADNQAIQRLNAELATGEAKLRELASQYGPNYPLYQRQVAQNQALRERLASERQRATVGAASIARQSRQRESELNGAMAAQRAKMLSQRDIRDEAMVLRHNVESAARAYDTTLQRATTTQVESNARRTNVTVLNPAVAAGKPTSPRLTLNVALAFAVGTMLGIGVIMLMEMSDRRMRSHDDLGKAIDAPVLVVLHRWSPPRTALLPAPPNAARALTGPG